MFLWSNDRIGLKSYCLFCDIVIVRIANPQPMDYENHCYIAKYLMCTRGIVFTTLLGPQSEAFN